MNEQTNEKLVCGVGVMDVPGGTTSNGKTCPIYRAWGNMLKLCFTHEPARATICPEWGVFSTYRDWYLANVPKGGVIKRSQNHFSPATVKVTVPRKRITLKDISISVDGVVVNMADVMEALRGSQPLTTLLHRN
ncbi:hypothetical protein [Pseudomonas sp. Marseille-Q7302]